MMEVILLKNDPKIYSCHTYLVRDDNDDNITLIDAGTDANFILELRDLLYSKSQVLHQILLTHSHFDHAGGLPKILGYWKAKVYAFSPRQGVTNKVNEVEKLTIAGLNAFIYHTPGHTHDSVSVYIPDKKIFFSGDTTLDIRNTIGSYHISFLEALELMASLDIEIIYPGHGKKITDNIKEMFERTIMNVKNSQVYG